MLVFSKVHVCQMWILSFVFWWKLHVVTEKSFEIDVIFLEDVEGSILKFYSYSFFEDVSGEEAIGIVSVVGQ